MEDFSHIPNKPQPDKARAGFSGFWQIGELMDLELPEGEDMESLKAFWEQTKERERRAEEIADDIFPMDFHIYEIRCPGNGMMQVSVETVL